MDDLAGVLIGPGATLRQALAAIDHNGTGIVVVVDEQERLVTTVTDGDIRRAVLRGSDLDSAALEAIGPHEVSSAVIGTGRPELLALMRARRLRHIPVLDGERRVVSLAVLDELVEPPLGPGLRAVVMAGGFGKRLLPLTEQVPKPMLPVGDRPAIEHVVEHLRDLGIGRILVATHYRPEVIVDHLGDGRRLGVQITYLNEADPLGTAGALGLMDAPDGPVLVVNGDVISEVDYAAMYRFHQEAGADLTVAVRQVEINVPYGIVEIEGQEVRGLTEKPTLRFFVNAGVYILEPGVIGLIERGERIDATDLILRAMAGQSRVVGFPIHEYWIDIGQPADYERANQEMVDRATRVQ